MLKKITLIILLLIVLAAGWFLATKTFTGKTETADNAELPTDTTADPTLFEPALPFDPDPDGFRFRNYSGRYPEGNLTIAEARAMFGDAVCIRLQNDTCIPHPKVITWLDDMNETMNEVGHCVGFTVASNQLHTDIRSVNELGAEITFDLEQDIPVLRTISQAYASYYASNVWTQEVQGKTPTEIIEALLTLDEPVDIGIFYPEYGRNGHSILGHNVVDQGNGIYHILVYDSNRPGEDNVIVVDTNEDTWFYAEGAVNPDQPTGDYQGDAETKSLTFVPISAYNEPLACPADFAELCPSASSASRFSVLTLFGRGQVLADTADGQIGQSGDTLINTVSGGQFIPVKGELYSRQQPLMLIPSEEAFTLQAQGNQADAPLKISVANPTYSVVVDGLIGQPGQLEQLTFDPAAQQVSFVAGGSQRPLIEFTFNQNGDVYSVQVSGLTFEAGQDLSVTVDAANGDLQLSSEGLAGDEIVLMVTRLNPDGESVFASSEVALLPAATQALDLDSWDGVGPMAVLVDGDGDGDFESDTTLNNQPVADVLTAIGSAENSIESLQSIVSYLDDTQKTAVAAALPTLNLSGKQLGTAYLQLPELRPDDLTAVVADLPPQEIGRFTVAINLDADETTSLLDGLALPSAARAAAEKAVTDMKTVTEALDNWEFLNPPDADGLATFLAEQGLDNDQVDDFIALAAPPQVAAVPQPTEQPANTPVPTPDNTPTPTAAELCANIPSPKEADVMLRFVNISDSPMTFSWIDFNGNLDPVRTDTIPPNQYKDRETYPTHEWAILDSNNQIVTTVVAGSGTAQCALIP